MDSLKLLRHVRFSVSDYKDVSTNVRFGLLLKKLVFFNRFQLPTYVMQEMHLGRILKILSYLLRLDQQGA